MAKAQEVTLPPLGENVEEAEVLKLLVSEGDRVEEEQALAELETDKATFEVPAPFAGSVRSVRIQAGDSVRVGQVLLEIEPAEGGGAEAEAPAAGREREEEGGAAAEERGAKEPGAERGAGTEEAGEGARGEAASGEGARAETAAGEGAAAEAREEPSRGERQRGHARREERAAREPGAERSAARERGARAEPPAPEERAASSRERVAGRPVPPEARGRPAEREDLGEPAPAAPSVRRLARELGIDVDEVPGSGPAGRISGEDVKAHARRIIGEGRAPRRGGGPASRGAPASPSLPDFSRWGEVERDPMSGIRRKTAENMTRSWNLIPHVAQFDKADVTELEAARRRFAPRAEAAGGKLTVTALAIKVLASALKVFPKLNASLDLENEEVVLKRYVHVGVAVDTDHGLIVPVIRDADRKTALEIAAELADLSERTRRRRVRPEELQGANITVTNLGGLGTTWFAPIVNWPEVAVLGLGRAEPQPVWRGESFEPRTILPLSVSYDHRLVDGADAARFLRWIAEALENPILLALEG